MLIRKADRPHPDFCAASCGPPQSPRRPPVLWQPHASKGGLQGDETPAKMLCGAAGLGQTWPYGYSSFLDCLLESKATVSCAC